MIEDSFIPRSQRDWDMVRGELLRWSDWLCEYCDVPLSWKGSSIDHRVPRCKSGTDHFANFAIACVRCNSAKGGRDLDEWVPPSCRGLLAELS